MLSYHQYHNDATLYHIVRRMSVLLTVSPVPGCQEGITGWLVWLSLPAQVLFSISGK